MECLSDILNADRYNEMVRSEAAGVVAQITSPTLDHYQHINGFIENMEDLIRSLTSMYFFLSYLHIVAFMDVKTQLKDFSELSGLQSRVNDSPMSVLFFKCSLNS